jgi:hypothetical protein
MRRRICLVAVLAVALCAAGSVFGQGADASSGNRDVRQLLTAAQQQMAAGDFTGAGATLDRTTTLGGLSQQEVSVMLYLRGQVFYELGQPGQAVSVWTQALSVGGLPEAQRQALEKALAQLADQAAPAKTPASPQELLQAADRAAQFGRADEATTYYDGAIKGFAAEGDATGLAKAHYGFGNHLASRRDFASALSQFTSAVEQAEQAGEAPLLKSALGAMGRAAIVADRPADGRAALTRLLELLGDEKGAPRANALAGIAEASLRLKDWPTAVDAYEQWFAVVNAAEQPDGGERVLHAYALSLRLAGRADDALATVKRLDAMAKSDAERGQLALQLEQDGARARRLDNGATGCWFDARAQERYTALGRKEDADVLQAVIDAENCSD